MSISVELFSKHGEKAAKLSVCQQEADALWYLWHVSSRLLIKDKKVSGITVKNSSSKAQSFWACCATRKRTLQSELRFSTWKVLKDNVHGGDPLQMISVIMHIAAHEIGHHLALQKYGVQMGAGHGRPWLKVMDETFGIRGKRVINGEYCWDQVPQFTNREQMLWDLYDLYLLWRLEGAKWGHPLCKKLLGQ